MSGVPGGKADDKGDEDGAGGVFEPLAYATGTKKPTAAATAGHQDVSNTTWSGRQQGRAT